MILTHTLFALLVGLLIGLFLGWVNAHSTIATECRRLGGFYVDRSTFKCIEIQEPTPRRIRAPASDVPPPTLNDS